MKNAAVTVILGIILLSSFVWLAGCQNCCIPGIDEHRCTQLGETAAEGNRRNIRNARINHEQMNEDFAEFWLYRQPSTLTDKRIP